MAFDFPNAPVAGQQVIFPDATSRTWDGAKWQCSATTSGIYIPITGGTLTGPLTLVGDPTSNFQVATKQYVDQRMGPGFLPLVGGTITGNLTIATGTGNDATLYLNKPTSGRVSQLIGETAGSIRWTAVLGNQTAESGANVGSDFGIQRYNDSGAFIDAPLIITRSTGNLAMGHNLSITTSDGQLNVTATAGQHAATILTRGAGYHGYVSAFTASKQRWLLSFADNTAESGSNAGSNFVLYRYNDAGGYIDSPFNVTRSTGLTTLSSLSVTGMATFAGGATVTGQGIKYSKFDSFSDLVAIYWDGTWTHFYVNGTDLGNNATTSWLTNNFLGYNGGTVTGQTQATGNIIYCNALYPCYNINGNFVIYGNASYEYLQWSSNWALRWDVSSGLLYWIGASGGLWYVDASGNNWRAGQCYATGYAATCDVRLKDDIQPFTTGLKEIRRLRPNSWRYNGSGNVRETEHRHVGVHAQDVIDIIPECIHVMPKDDDQPFLDGQMAVDTAPILAAAINAIKELDQQCQELTDQILVLEGKS